MRNYSYIMGCWRSRITNILIGSLLKRAEGAIIARVAELAADAVAKSASGTPKEELVRVISDALISSNSSRRAIEGSFVKSEYVEKPTSTRIREQKPNDTSLPQTKGQATAVSAPKQENSTLRLLKFLRLNYAFRYNEITRQIEVKYPDEADYVVLGKMDYNTITVDAHMNGINCWDRDVKRVIESRETKSYHPFKNYIAITPKWDGRDRVAPLLKRVSDNPVWVKYGRVWLRGMVAQWMDHPSVKLRANSVAPIIISTTQGLGKSTFCRLILPPELRYLFCENLNLNSKSLETKLTEAGLINLDEFDRLSPRQMAQLKSLMQQTLVNTTLKYQSGVSALHRIASFIATTNRRDILTDSTGSRRFLCVEPDHEIDCDTPIDYLQLYAQLKEEILAGEPVYLDKEAEREIQESNRAYRRISPEEEALRMHFNVVDKETPGAQLLSATQIFNILKKREKHVMHGVSANRISRLLPELGKSTHTMYGNGYYVIMT